MIVKITVTQEFSVRQGLKLRGGDSDQNSDFKQTVKLHVKDFPQLMN